MMEYAEARRVAAVLAALAEPTRLRILYHLANRPHFVGELAELLEIPMVNMSHHLGVMRQAGVLEDEKDGRKVIYRLWSDLFTPGKEAGILGVVQAGPVTVSIRSNPVLPAVSKPRRKRPGK